MREWVLQAEHILDGTWAVKPEEITNAEVAHRFAAWLKNLQNYLQSEGLEAEEQRCLGYLWKVLTALRPGLIHCYDIEGLPRTNNEMELLIRATKTRYRRISGRKNWNGYLLRYGRCVAYYEWWERQPEGDMLLAKWMHHVCPQLWRQIRQQTRESHQPQLNRYRLRRWPQHYLALLETRWEQVLRM